MTLVVAGGHTVSFVYNETLNVNLYLTKNKWNQHTDLKDILQGEATYIEKIRSLSLYTWVY